MITRNWIKLTRLLAKSKLMAKILEYGRLKIINQKPNKNRHKTRTTTKVP